jgi:hypothetical protein
MSGIASLTRDALVRSYRLSRQQKGVTQIKLRTANLDELLTLTDSDDWRLKQISDGEGARERIVELHAITTERLAEVIRDAEIFDCGDVRYERAPSVAPPGSLPGVWIVAMKPIGSLA